MEVKFTISDDDNDDFEIGYVREESDVLLVSLPGFGSGAAWGTGVVAGLCLQDGEVKLLVWAEDREEPTHRIVLEKHPKETT